MAVVVACSMMKDEGDVAYDVVRHLAGEGVHHIVVADNMSTDNTREELERVKADLAASPMEEEARCQVTILDDKDPGYYQSRKMTELAACAARDYPGAWVIPFDADEIWFAVDRFGACLDQLSDSLRAVEFPMWNHYTTGIDDNTGHPFNDMPWKMNEVGALPKVMFKWSPDVTVNQGNHSVTFESGQTRNVTWKADRTTMWGFQIRHFPYRSWGHFKRKAINGAAAYAATNLPYDQGAHWRQYGEILERHGEDALRTEVYEKWFHFMAPVNAGLVYDPAPVQRWLV